MTTGRRTILVVDDEEDVRQFLRLVFEGAGYHVETASNGREALTMLPEVQPQLMVLDLMMPVLDGWGTLAELAGRKPPVVLIVSAAADVERARREGAADCLAKPFSVRVLLETARGLLGP